MEKCDQAVDFSAGDTQRFRNARHGLGWHVAKGLLHSVKHGEQRTASFCVTLENGGKHVLVHAKIPVVARAAARGDSGVWGMDSAIQVLRMKGDVLADEGAHEQIAMVIALLQPELQGVVRTLSSALQALWSQLHCEEGVRVALVDKHRNTLARLSEEEACVVRCPR